jgi:hypothetical protein
MLLRTKSLCGITGIMAVLVIILLLTQCGFTDFVDELTYKDIPYEFTSKVTCTDMSYKTDIIVEVFAVAGRGGGGWNVKVEIPSKSPYTHTFYLGATEENFSGKDKGKKVWDSPYLDGPKGTTPAEVKVTIVPST